MESFNTSTQETKLQTKPLPTEVEEMWKERALQLTEQNLDELWIAQFGLGSIPLKGF